ncbi:MAG: heme-binding domain-containing protein [Chlorobiaceae bacterium]|nr:heme-binding domain-containing protein [Chlorobiaceae bacterium]
MNYSFKAIAGWSVLLLMMVQFIPLRRLNPPVQSDLQAPENVKKSLKKACYDCHSTETEWPAIAYMAPASWLIANRVNIGRNVLNFSLWNNNANTTLRNRDIQKVILKNPSHQTIYYTLQPSKALTQEECRTVLDWLESRSKTETAGIKN